MIFFYIGMDHSLKGDYEIYSETPAEVTIAHPDREEIEFEVLMEFAHGYGGDSWKSGQSPMACRVGCACGNLRPGTE